MSRFGRHTHHGGANGHGSGNNGSSSDHSPCTDSYSRHNGRTNTHKCTFFNNYLTTKVNAGSNMGTAADLIVMIYRTPGIQDRMRSDSCTSVDHNTCADHRARPNLYIGGNNSARMPGDSKTFSICGKRMRYATTRPIVPNGDNNSIVRYERKFIKCSQDG